MKKTLIFAFLLSIFIIGIGFWFYFKSKSETKDYYLAIPKNATVYGVVNVSKTSSTIISEALSNPNKLKKLKAKAERFLNKDGSSVQFDIASISLIHKPIFYNLNNNWHIQLAVKDTTALHKSLNTLLTAGYNWKNSTSLYNQKTNTAIIFNTKRLVASSGVSFKEAKNLFQLTSEPKNCINNDSTFRKILNNKRHLAFCFNGKGFKNVIAELEFNPGEIKINCNSDSSDNLIQGGFENHKLDSSIINGNFFFNKKKLRELVPKINYSDSIASITKFNLKEFYSNWKGSASFSIAPTNYILKEYKSYSYNEKFEKVEVIKTDQELVPNYLIEVNTKPTYFNELKLSKTISENNVFTPLPFYKTLVSNKTYGLQLANANLKYKVTNYKTTPVSLTADIQQLNKYYDLIHNLPAKYHIWINNLDELKASGIQKSGKLKGGFTATFTNKETNGLFTFLDLVFSKPQ